MSAIGLLTESDPNGRRTLALSQPSAGATGPPASGSRLLTARHQNREGHRPVWRLSSVTAGVQLDHSRAAD
jgi:hypothetical protein